MAKRYFLNGKEITADKAREIKKANQKLIDSGRVEDLVKCKVVCEADSESVIFGLTSAPKQPKPGKPAATSNKSKSTKTSAKKSATKRNKTKK